MTAAIASIARAFRPLTSRLIGRRHHRIALPGHRTVEALESRCLLACVVEENTCFAVIGDYGDAGTEEENVANLIKSWNVDLIITTGDNNYPDGEASTIDANVGQYYHDFIFPYLGSYGPGADTNRFFPSLGNHDWRAPGVQPYLDYFTLPGNERYYNFTWGPVEFFAVDSDGDEPDGNKSDSVQAAWLQNALAASTATWKVVYMHHPAYSSGQHGSDTDMQWPYQEWGATAVLAGHDHNYERIIVDGFPYFVNGLGGNGSRSFNTPVAGSESRYNADNGAMLVDASDTQITFQFISVGGEVVDTYSITTGPPLPTVSVVATDPTAAETGADTGSLTVSRSGDTGDLLEVGYHVSGSATNGTDYQLLDGTVTIPAGASSVTIGISPIDDSLSEADETVTIELAQAAGYNLATPFSASVTIADDEVVGQPAVVESRVTAGSDDAEENESGGVSLSSSDLELVFDGSHQNVGMRFNDVNIPRGATILNAHVQFQVDETSSDATSVTIRGEATDNALTFSSTDHNITSRTTTSSFVSWSPPSWGSVGAAGNDQRTPNLSSIIQEIVNRPGWSSANSLALLISGSGERVAESHDGDPTAAPLLHVEYVSEDNPPSENRAPVLSPIGDKAANENVQVSFSVVATDPDADSLTFSLDSGAPLGASIDPVTGNFQWPAGPDRQPGSYPVTIRVTDDGTPSLSDTETITVTIHEISSNQLVAFPGAEGFGAATIGGRGGQVFEVTNLNDSGPGSLRQAIEAQGPRTVVFRVGGEIELTSRLTIENPYITIAGQTAPGEGITLRNGPSLGKAPLVIKTHDVIIRYLRSRPGANPADTGNIQAVSVGSSSGGVYNVIIDHSSFSWSSDEIMNTWYGTYDVTIQWSIFSEGLKCSTHPQGCHSMGLLLGSDNSSNISVHHNLFAHNKERNPRIKTEGLVDVVNNVVYNPGDSGSWGPSHITDDFMANVPVNYVGNYFKPGPNSSTGFYISAGGSAEIFVDGNIAPDRPSNDMDQSLVVRSSDRGKIVPTRHNAPPVFTTSALEAFDQVLSDAGASLPKRDAVDKRIVDDVVTGRGKIIDDPSEVGGWPEIASGTPPLDSDHDGMADDWESSRGLDSNNPSDRNGDRNGDGYTNLEEYLHWLTLPNTGNPNAGTIHGALFDDTDADGVHDPTESGLTDWTVYIDGDNDGQFDAGERNTSTVDGNFAFEEVAAGTHVIRLVSPVGWISTTGTNGQTVELGEGETASVSVGYRQAFEVSGQTVTFFGTDSDDNVSVTPNGGTNPTVLLNGRLVAPIGSFTQLIVNSMSGNDSVHVTGSPGDDTARLYPGHGRVELPSVMVELAATESISVSGEQGHNRAYFYDSPRDDQFTAHPQTARLSGDTFDNLVQGFDRTYGFATQGGHDRAELYDSPHKDFFASTPEFGRLSGASFYSYAGGFKEVRAHATAGGHDRAFLHDSTGDDLFVATPDGGQMIGIGFDNNAQMFDRVYAYSTAGGYDAAQLRDSDENDYFEGNPQYIRLSGASYYNRAEGFEEVVGIASAGFDRAYLYDTSGDDIYTADENETGMIGPDVNYRVSAFDRIYGYASTGNDVAKFLNLDSDDLVVGKNSTASVFGPSRDQRADGFNVVQAFAKTNQTPATRIKNIDYLYQQFGW